MVMQVRRTLTVGAVPTGLLEGQISVGMADQPPIAWVGVPTSVNPAGVIPITGLVRTVAGAPQPAGALGQLWWDEDAAQLFVYTGSEWVVAVNPPIPDLSGFMPIAPSGATPYVGENGAWVPLTIETMPGVTDGSNPAPGFVGEYVTIDSGGGVPAQANYWTVAQMTLQPGDWDLAADLNFFTAAGDLAGDLHAAVNTSTTWPTDGLLTGGLTTRGTNALPRGFWAYIPNVRVNITAATTYYLLGNNATAILNGAPALTVIWRMRARRMR